MTIKTDALHATRQRHRDVIALAKWRHYEILDDVEARRQALIVLGDGKGFGEIALISAKPRGATVVAGPNCQLIVIEKEEYSRIIGFGTFQENACNIDMQRQSHANNIGCDTGYLWSI